MNGPATAPTGRDAIVEQLEQLGFDGHPLSPGAGWRGDMSDAALAAALAALDVEFAAMARQREVPGAGHLMRQPLPVEPSVIGSILLCDEPAGELTAYLGIDLAAVVLPGESQQLIRIDDHLLQDDARRLQAREVFRHLGLELAEGGNHLIVRDLADALVILGPKPCDPDRSGLDHPPHTPR